MDIKHTLTICVLAKAEICAITSACITKAKEDNRITNCYNICQVLCIGQSDLPKVRSNALTGWYENNAKPGDIFMFIDADQIFLPDDIIEAIIHLQQADVVCGAYAKKSGGMTVEPKYPVKFYDDKQGEIWYGATGFMAINFDIVDILAKQHLKQKFMTGKDVLSYQFFYERIVHELSLDMWLSEDYSFCWLVRSIGGKVYGFISPTIGHIVTQEKYVTIPVCNKWPDKSIVYYCHSSHEKWSPNSIKNGIGGSELAVIKLAPLWIKAGYTVTVFCDCDKPGNYDGVIYKDVKEFNFTDIFDIIIIWRNLKILDTTDLKARLRIMDLHDDIQPEKITPRLIEYTNMFCTKSLYQSLHLPTEKVIVIPNGGICQYNFEEKRDPNYIIYSSSYDRGLIYMLKWGWPKIKKACPNAYLNIYYGWNGYDKVYPNGTEFKKICCELMKQDGVKECGRISQEELAREKSKANIHYYTGNFPEIDCISVRESAYLGAIPVVSQEVAVFKEKSYCILVEGDPKTKEMQEKAADKIIELILNEELANNTRKDMIVPNETWEYTASKWLEIFEKKD